MTISYVRLRSILSATRGHGRGMPMGHEFRNPPPPHVLIVHPWIPLLRGFWALVFSELTLFMPDMTLKALSILFGFYALIDGAFAFLLAVRTPASGQHWW